MVTYIHISKLFLGRLKFTNQPVYVLLECFSKTLYIKVWSCQCFVLCSIVLFFYTYVPIALINQLCTDGHITDVEASRLTSDKLFKTPPLSATTTLPITLNTNSVHDGVQMTSSLFCNSNSSTMLGATNTANQKVFLASAAEEEEATRLASEKVFKMPSGSTAAMLLNAGRNSVHNSVVQTPSTCNDSNNTTTTTSSIGMLLPNGSNHECEAESKLSATNALALVPPNNHGTHDLEDRQTTIPTNNISDHLQLLSDNGLETTAVDNESVMPSIAMYTSDSGCCSIDNEPILRLVVTSERAKESAEGTYV